MAAPIVARSAKAQFGAGGAPTSPAAVSFVLNDGETGEFTATFGGASPGVGLSITGGGTWTLLSRVTNSTGRVEKWGTGIGGARAATSLSFAFTPNTTDALEVIPAAITGALALGSIATNVGTAANPTVSLVTQTADSLVTGGFVNADNTILTPTPTALTGNLDQADGISAFGAYDSSSALTDNTSALPATIVNAITYAPTTGHWAAIAIEYLSVAVAQISASRPRRKRARGPLGRRDTANSFFADRIFAVAVATALFAMPLAAIFAWINPDPSVALGNVTAAPSAAASTWVNPNPTVVLGNVTASPSAAASTWVNPDPTVVLGNVTASPAAVVETWIVLAPAAQMGAVVATPAAAVATWITPDPSVALGNVTGTPAAAVSTWVNPDPQFTAAGQTAAPASAVRTWVNPDPSVQLGPVVVSPAPAVREWVNPDPTFTAPSTIIPGGGGEFQWRPRIKKAPAPEPPQTAAVLAAGRRWVVPGVKVVLGEVRAYPLAARRESVVLPVRATIGRDPMEALLFLLSR